MITDPWWEGCDASVSPLPLPSHTAPREIWGSTRSSGSFLIADYEYWVFAPFAHCASVWENRTLPYFESARLSTACRETALVLGWFNMTSCSVVYACPFFTVELKLCQTRWPPSVLSGSSLEVHVYKMILKEAKWTSSTAEEKIPACCYISAFWLDGTWDCHPLFFE